MRTRSRPRRRELDLHRTFEQIVATIAALPIATLVACSHPPDTSDGSLSTPIDATSESLEYKDAASCTPLAVDAFALDPEGGACDDFRLLPCGLPDDAALQGCLLETQYCADICGTDGGLYYCHVPTSTCPSDASVPTDASLIIECERCLTGSGRPPRGLMMEHVVTGAHSDSVGAWFATMASMEAASVVAFQELSVALRAHRAPLRLRRAAKRAACDEQRHARAMARAARRFGASPRRPTITPTPPSTLCALLEDNLVAGCVGETFGALLITWQASHTRDAEISRTLERIALDETSHAALSWEILRWGKNRLDRDEVDQLRNQLDTALTALARTTPTDESHEVIAVGGHPTKNQERGLRRAAIALVRERANEFFGRRPIAL